MTPTSSGRHDVVFRTAVLLAIGVAASCADEGDSPGRSGDAPVEAWSLTAAPLVEVGVREGEDPYLLHRVTSGTVLSDGRIVVANDGSSELRFYDADGAHLGSAGARGEAPGEYRVLDRVRAVAPDTLAVFDTFQQRISLVSAADGAYLGARDYDPEHPFPFDEWVLGRSIVDSPVPPEERGALAATLAALPPFTGGEHRYVRVTESGHLWVTGSKVPPPGRSARWRVFDLSGRQVAEVETPAGLVVLDIGPDWLLGRWSDALDVEYVRLYGLVREGAREVVPDALRQAVDGFDGAPPAFTRVAGEDVAPVFETMRMMAGSEEMFYSEHYRYTISLDSLRAVNPRFTIPDGVTLTPLWVEEQGWMYMGTVEGSSATCFISFGFVRIIGRMPGEIACWEDPLARSPENGE